MTVNLKVRSYPFRHALSVGFSVFLAWVVNRYFSFSGEYWVVLSALLVSQATMGTPVRQGYIFLTILEVAILFAAALTAYVHQPLIVYFVMALLLAGSGYWVYLNRPMSNKNLYVILLFSFVLMIAVLSPGRPDENVQNRAVDALIGAIIGIWSVVLVLPAKLDREFGEGIVPILCSIKAYARALTHCLLDADSDEAQLARQKLDVERALQISHGIYPEWVYEVGFNRGLRSGFRFFLIQLERITEVLFSLEFIVRRGVDGGLVSSFSESVREVMRKNDELIDVLIAYFLHHKIAVSSADFSGDVADLEKALQRSAAFNLELLEISPGHLAAASLVRDVRDLRELLLQLAMALPAPDRIMPRVEK
ncbi:hypothetical protein AQUSIP_21150 [Aquicella siphonis]|uniref:Integral membrane bound transporter domain-containing protein n=1 Tax=Aquicella siphonis TaxID=254247 RepID=A0A5E4PJY1_9COXI|nr:FUSC family protein [Aquicella siphonis]VVC76788.1 hypothetical protein AQUSIP_21150 [Aquicella siphonis]